MRTPTIGWVVLTMGTRPEALLDALRSIRSCAGASHAGTLVVLNGADPDSLPDEVAQLADVVALPENVGIPEGRAIGLARAEGDVIAFLDDDARVVEVDLETMVADAFADDPRLGAVSFRLVDEAGETARRHVPRRGAGSADESGEVVGFLGGASAVRRTAWEDSGGYWGALFYGHEELELSWRLIDHGWTIRYLADATVFHPSSEIGRHADGWRMTGRNRVWVARRTLPMPLAVMHTLSWLAIGAARTDGDGRRAYLAGWREGWRTRIRRAPIRWSTVWRLTRLGRPPVV